MGRNISGRPEGEGPFSSKFLRTPARPRRPRTILLAVEEKRRRYRSSGGRVVTYVVRTAFFCTSCHGLSRLLFRISYGSWGHRRPSPACPILPIRCDDFPSPVPLSRIENPPRYPAAARPTEFSMTGNPGPGDRHMASYHSSERGIGTGTGL